MEKKLKKVKINLDSHCILCVYLGEMRKQVTKKGKKSYE